MQAMWDHLKTLRDLLEAMISKRWVRYLVAAGFSLFGILIGIQALIGMQIRTASGVVHSIQIKRDMQTGDYQEHLLTLDGSTMHYAVEADAFTPPLPAGALQEAERVDLWYVQVPLFDPEVVALQVYDPAGGAPTKYTTQAYTNPEGARSSNVVTSGVFLLIGLLALVAAIWLPVRAEANESRTPADQQAGPPRYGEWVVGPDRQPSAARDPGARSQT